MSSIDELRVIPYVRGAEVEPPPSPGVEVQGASGPVSRPDPRPAPTKGDSNE